MTELSANDDSFVAFAFAIVSLIVFAVYLPVVLGLVRDLRRGWNALRGQAPSYQEDDGFMITQVWHDVMRGPQALRYVFTHPQAVLSGVRCIGRRMDVARGVILPRVLSYCVRPKLLLLVVWFILFSSAMYTSLSFDPHGILGVEASASLPDIKRAGRRLMRRYHPDVNRTEEAKPIYAKIRKAYKALVDPSTFEEETKNDSLEVGIALPKFLTAKENEAAVVFGLLALLLVIPGLIWWYVSGGGNRTGRLLQSIVADEQMSEGLLKDLGAPCDGRLHQTRTERQILHEALVRGGLLPAETPCHAVDKFLPLRDLKQKVAAPARFKTAIKKWGLDDAALAKLTAAAQAVEAAPEAESIREFVKTDLATYESTMYLLRELQCDVEEKIDELCEGVARQLGRDVIDLKNAGKLKQHHKDFNAAVEALYSGKGSARDVAVLLESSQKRDSFSTALTEELQVLLQRAYQMMQEEQRRAEEEEAVMSMMEARKRRR